MISKIIIFWCILLILSQEIDAGIFVKGKTHNIDPIGYGGAKDPATLQSNEPIRPKRNVGETNKLEYPIAIQWTIPEYRLMALKGNPSGHLSSASFNISKIPGLQYYIGISPNIIEEGTDQGETWIYLSLQNFGEKIIEANFNILIESANYSVSKKSVFNGYESVGIKCFGTDQLFNPDSKLIIDGKMIIKMNGILRVEKDKSDDVKTWEGGSFADSLGLILWNQENDKNVTLVFVDGKEITVHKTVLSARSPVFANIFESGINETRIVLDGFEFEIVEKAIKLCYHHSLVNETTLEEKMKLLYFFDEFKIQQLKDNLEEYLIFEIDDSNVCRLTNSALISNAPKLERKCVEFLQECMKTTQPISDIDLLNKDFALKLLKNAFYHVSE